MLEKGNKDFLISNKETIFKRGAQESEKKVKCWMRNQYLRNEARDQGEEDEQRWEWGLRIEHQKQEKKHERRRKQYKTLGGNGISKWTLFSPGFHSW